MFSYVSAEPRIPKDHPLRAIRALVDEVLADMSREFDRLYATTGRPSIPPERLLRAPEGSAIDGRTTRHAGYAMSQHARPRIEPAFGWLKTIAWIRRVKLRASTRSTGCSCSRARHSI
jgi:hypothetical protein